MPLTGSLIARRARHVLAAAALLSASAVAATAQEAPAFAWDRFYAGVYTGYWVGDGIKGGVVAGHNFALGDHIVLGLEASTGFWQDSPPNWEWTAQARLGVLIGDRVLVYGGAGFNDPSLSSPPSFILTTGIELGIGANTSIRGEIIFFDPLSTSGVDSFGVSLVHFFGD